MPRGPEFTQDPNTSPEGDFTNQGFEDWRRNLAHLRPDIVIPTVLRKLEPYPLLHSLFMDTLTNEELEKYAVPIYEERVREDAGVFLTPSQSVGIMRQQEGEKGFHVDIFKTGENATALVHEFPGMSSTGKTGDEALLNIDEAISLHQQNLRGIISAQESK